MSKRFLLYIPSRFQEEIRLVATLHSTFDDAADGIYPNVIFLAAENGVNYAAENFNDLVLKVEEIIVEAEQLAASIES